MAFQKGNQFGNRRGAHRKGESLSELIRASCQVIDEGERVPRITRLLDRMWRIGLDAHDRPDLVLKFADYLASRGWPYEQKGLLDDLPADGSITVTWKS
jgi:hypothetical protein